MTAKRTRIVVTIRRFGLGLLFFLCDECLIISENNNGYGRGPGLKSRNRPFCILYYTTIYNSFKSIIPSYFVNTHTILSYIQIHCIVSSDFLLHNVTDFAQHTKLQQLNRVFFCTFLSGSVLYSLKYNNTIMQYNQNYPVKIIYI